MAILGVQFLLGFALLLFLAFLGSPDGLNTYSVILVLSELVGAALLLVTLLALIIVLKPDIELPSWLSRRRMTQGKTVKVGLITFLMLTVVIRFHNAYKPLADSAGTIRPPLIEANYSTSPQSNISGAGGAMSKSTEPSYAPSKTYDQKRTEDSIRYRSALDGRHVTRSEAEILRKAGESVVENDRANQRRRERLGLN